MKVSLVSVIFGLAGICHAEPNLQTAFMQAPLGTLPQEVGRSLSGHLAFVPGKEKTQASSRGLSEDSLACEEDPDVDLCDEEGVTPATTCDEDPDVDLCDEEPASGCSTDRETTAGIHCFTGSELLPDGSNVLEGLSGLPPGSEQRCTEAGAKSAYYSCAELAAYMEQETTAKMMPGTREQYVERCCSQAGKDEDDNLTCEDDPDVDLCDDEVETPPPPAPSSPKAPETLAPATPATPEPLAPATPEPLAPATPEPPTLAIPTTPQPGPAEEGVEDKKTDSTEEDKKTALTCDEDPDVDLCDDEDDEKPGLTCDEDPDVDLCDDEDDEKPGLTCDDDPDVDLCDDEVETPPPPAPSSPTTPEPAASTTPAAPGSPAPATPESPTPSPTLPTAAPTAPTAAPTVPTPAPTAPTTAPTIPTSDPTPHPTQPPASVNTQIKITNLDFASLMSDTVKADAVKNNVAIGIAAKIDGIDASDVRVALRDGSVIADIEITPKVESVATLGSVLTKMEELAIDTSTGLAQTVIDQVNSVEGIESHKEAPGDDVSAEVIIPPTLMTPMPTATPTDMPTAASTIAPTGPTVSPTTPTAAPTTSPTASTASSNETAVAPTPVVVNQANETPAPPSDLRDQTDTDADGTIGKSTAMCSLITMLVLFQKM